MGGRGFQAVRAQVFERSPVLEEAVAAAGWEFTQADLVAAAQRLGAWQALRGRLARERALQAVDAGERWIAPVGDYLDLLRQVSEVARLGVEVRDLRSGVEALARLLRRGSQPRPRVPVPVRWRPSRPVKEFVLAAETLVEEQEVALPEAVMGQLMALLSALVRAFGEELERVGKAALGDEDPPAVEVEVRVPGRAAGASGVAGLGTKGFTVSEFGDSVVLTAFVPFGTARTVVSGALWGPAVVERMFYAAGGGVEGGRIQARVWGGSGEVDPAAGPAAVLGDSLFLSASTAGGGQGAVVEADAFVGRAEWWPRRLVPYSSWRVVFTAENTGTADRWMSLALDVRGAVWKG